ncbi:MAG: PAS domain S-box protein, partial [Candidatus Solibacter sp.]
MEQAADGVVLTDTEGRIQYVNPAFTALTGYSADEAVGQNPRVLKSGLVPDAVYAGLWQTIRAGDIWQGELLNRRKDGTTYLEEMRIAPVLGDGGSITGYIAIKRDVTERRASEKAQRFLAAIVESSEDAIAALTPEGTILTWNRGAEAICGYTAAEAVGMPVLQLVEYPDRLQRFMERVLAGQVVSQHEGVCRHKSGRSMLVSVTGSPVRDRDGQVVAISAILRDMTARRKTEQALRESEEKFRQLAETISEVFWIVDPATLAVLYVSPAYEQVWGRTVESVYRDPATWFEAIHPDDRETAARMLQAQISGATSTAEFRVQLPDGSEKWIRDRAFPV